MTKEEYVRFVREAMADKSSDCFKQLYQFHIECFVSADKDKDGKVFMDDFDELITYASIPPRKHGLAPSEEEMYPTEESRKASRAKMFKEMNTAKDGYITIEEWLSFSLKHIQGKVKTLPKDPLAESVTKKEFLAFITKAVDKATPEYKELYYFLLRCFVKADSDHDGCVTAEEFDSMIEVAAAVPRRHGLAPSTKKLYKNDADRLAKRTEEFKKMDTNDSDTISFDEWLKYAVDHIACKVQLMNGGDKSQNKTKDKTSDTSKEETHSADSGSQGSGKKSNTCTLL